MGQVAIRLEIPTLSGGWEGTLDQWAQWFKENAKFYIDGDTISGTVGGAAPNPTEDSGLFFNADGIESFRDGKYRPITDVPIGVVLSWGGTIAVAPTNYLLCDGSEYDRDDYSDLFAVVGTAFTPDGTDAALFCVPDLRGRVAYGAGEGTYEEQEDVGAGKTKEYEVGDMIGASWPVKRSLYPSAPATKMFNILGTSLQPSGNFYTDTTQPGVALRYIIRYR